jgi:N-acetylmuramoyl-L-alanine amidase CwlA
MYWKKGIAGKRGCKPTYIVFHNDGGRMTAKQYEKWLPTHEAEKGFAHAYVDSDYVFRAEDEENITWHAGNKFYNTNALSVEVCQSLGDESVFLKNEKAAIKLVVEWVKKYDIPLTNILFHRQVAATACPARTIELHGKDMNKAKEWIIGEIKSLL